MHLFLIQMKKYEIQFRKYRAKALGSLVPHYQHLFIDLFQREKENVRRVLKLNDELDTIGESKKKSLTQKANSYVSNLLLTQNQASKIRNEYTDDYHDSHEKLRPGNDGKMTNEATLPSNFAKIVGLRFSKWPLIEFIQYKEYEHEINDFRKHYQMELVSIVFLLSLRALQNFIVKQKIKIDAQGAQQLAVDIKFIIESICTSDLLKAKEPEFQTQFKAKLLNLYELKKWKRLIQILIETQFTTLSVLEGSVGSDVSDIDKSNYREREQQANSRYQMEAPIVQSTENLMSKDSMPNLLLQSSSKHINHPKKAQYQSFDKMIKIAAMKSQQDSLGIVPRDNVKKSTDFMDIVKNTLSNELQDLSQIVDQQSLISKYTSKYQKANFKV